MELTNSLRQTIKGLDRAKNRRETGLFMAEGTKCVVDTLPYFKVYAIVATNEWINEHAGFIREHVPDDALICVPARELSRISQLKSTPQVVAVYHIPSHNINLIDLSQQLCIALDCVQDPGNLGTIIRTADWMGVYTILATQTTVDVYSPKVVQATMGGISRVKVHYFDNLASVLQQLREFAPVYGTTLDGKNIYDCPLSSNGVIVMGNEGNGISDEISNQLTHKLFIPSYAPVGVATSESLNVATATAITLAEFRRRVR